MTEKVITKKKAQEFLKAEGETRGFTLKCDWDFVLLKKGEGALKELEKKMAELGLPLKHKDIKTMGFYPIGYDTVSMLIIKEMLGYDNKDMEKLGASAVKFSLVLRVFMKYFSSLKLIGKQLPVIWKRHYTVGKLHMPEFDEDKKYAIVRLEDFNIHPIYCYIIKGYFAKIAQMILSSDTTIEETKCAFRGDDYHEFLLKW